MRDEIKFLLKFLPLYFIPFFLIARVLPLGFLTDLTAFIQSKLLSLAGVTNQLAGSFIYPQKISFEIVPECTGLSMVILLFALLYSTKINPRKRLSALLLYTPLLLLFNQIRLFALLFIGATNGQSALDYAHPAFWLIDAGLVFALWYFVLQKTHKNKKTKKNNPKEKQKAPSSSGQG